MGGILSRAEGSPKASQNACRQSVLGSIDLVSLCVDYLVVDELYGSARPVCPGWRAAADLTPGRLSLERRPGESLAARDAELHERRFKRWCAATLRPGPMGNELDRLVAYDRPSIVLIAGDDGSAQIFGAPNGRHFTVRDLLDAMIKHEKRLMRFPTGHAHFVGLRQHERWPAMYYVVWEWYPDEGEPFLIE